MAVAASILYALPVELQRHIAHLRTDRPTHLTYAVAQQLVIAYKNGQLTPETIQAMMYLVTPPAKAKVEKTIRLYFGKDVWNCFVDIDTAPKDIERDSQIACQFLARFHQDTILWLAANR